MTIVRTLFFLLLALPAVSCKQSNILDEALASGEPFFSVVHTRGFGTRFSFTGSSVSTLEKGLHAIAIEFNKVNDQYTCKLHLYVDSGLDVYVPNRGRYFAEKPMAEYFFAIDYNENDLAFNNYVLNNHMRIKFLSLPTAQESFSQTLSYEFVHKSFLPELTLLTLNTGCYTFNQDYYPADIWIQKQGVGDYLLGNDGPAELTQPKNNYRFPVPQALIEQAKPYVDIAVRHNAGKRGWRYDNDGLIGIQVTSEVLQDDIAVDPAVLNSGEINAEGVRVLLTGSTSQDVFSNAVNHEGIEQAIELKLTLLNRPAIHQCLIQGVLRNAVEFLLQLGKDILDKLAIDILLSNITCLPQKAHDFSYQVNNPGRDIFFQCCSVA